MTKKCTKCGIEKDVSKFYRERKNLDERYSSCRDCKDFAYKLWQENNLEHKRKYGRERYHKLKLFKWNPKPSIKAESYTESRKRYNKKLSDERIRKKEIVILAYGGKCACCGETERDFLCIDHKNGGGNQHRKQIGSNSSRFRDLIIENNFPDDYQILCYNCNCSKGFFGQCPHERARQVCPKNSINAIASSAGAR